jgi:hypothetical protein
MGTRETTESEEMQVAIKRIEDTRSSLKDVYKKLNKQLKAAAGKRI